MKKRSIRRSIIQQGSGRRLSGPSNVVPFLHALTEDPAMQARTSDEDRKGMARQRWRDVIRMVIALQRVAMARTGAEGTEEPTQLVDYFTGFGLDMAWRERCGTALRNAARAVGGGGRAVREVVKSYNESLASSRYRPRVLSRYPLADLPNFPLDPNWASFGFPDGLKLAVPEVGAGVSPPPPPHCYYSVMTLADGMQLFAAYLCYQEPIISRESCGPDRTTPAHASELEGMEVALRVTAPTVLMLVSHYPLFETFRPCLEAIYCMLRRGRCCSVGVPLEKYIVQLVDEIPLPVAGDFSVQFSLDQRVVRASLSSRYGQSSFGMDQLFAFLTPANVVTLLAHLLTEARILLVSSSRRALCVVMQCLLQLLHPFQWFYPYIPLLTEETLIAHEMPQPYLIGAHRSHLPHLTELEDVVLVDLDANSVKSNLNPISPPDKAGKELRECLRTAHADWIQTRDWVGPHVGSAALNTDPAAVPEVHSLSPEEVLTRECYRAMMEFFAAVVKDYRNFLFFIQDTPFFNAPGFLSHRVQTDPTSEAFYSAFLGSRAFDVYVEEVAITNKIATPPNQQLP